ncbi:calcium-binding protein [Roseomonas terrae]|jgi:Ca2+-binding RTX toxin-like protein|uniref:Calcium-binding protein n=1 Tax=Neoroseomonas terrae TaxID=424799 RepID=A0ABS5EKF0_9PROT|nr:calcium-binding protein [Neoroseomonas terrae]MBR0651508.1 calcium-binding protein [Neoroseomonas terrae]
MATITVSTSVSAIAVPFAAMPSVIRLPGATSTSATYQVIGSSATITLTGVGFTYDGQSLPSGGTLASVQYRHDGSTLSWTASGLNVAAASFRANAATLYDLLYGGSDTVIGGSGADRLLGYGGNDSLVGGTGADTLLGGDGNDTLVDGGSTGANDVRGEGGNDFIRMGVSNDAQYVDGGAGEDTLQAVSITGWTVTGFEALAWHNSYGSVSLTAAQIAQFDTFVIQGPANRAELRVESGGVIDLSAITYDFAAGQRLEVFAEGGVPHTVIGRDSSMSFANDEVFVMGDFSNIATFGGSDTITATGIASTVDGGAGDDRIWFSEHGLSRILGGDGNDRISLVGQTPSVTDGSSTIDGGAGNDRISASEAGDSILGGAGEDTIVAEGGADTILGGIGGDSILGGAGNDSIIGGSGGDTLSGGPGADRFVYDDGDSGVIKAGQLVAYDTILDFNRAQGDRVDLSAVDASTGMLGDQAFSAPLAAGSPTPVGAGSLRYMVGATETIIEGSTDADADMEFRIVIAVPGYTPIAADFIL